jgi:hypothetical protein
MHDPLHFDFYFPLHNDFSGNFY